MIWSIWIKRILWTNMPNGNAYIMTFWIDELFTKMASHTISIAGSDLRWIVWIIICLTCILISDRNVKGCPTRTIRLRVHLQTWRRTSIIIAVCPYKTECDLSADTLRICSIGWFNVYYAAPQAAYYAIPNEEVFKGASLPACKVTHRDTLTLFQPAKWPIRLKGNPSKVRSHPCVFQIL